MKKTFIIITMFLFAASACKKKPAVYTSMTVTVNGDSTWTTNNVTMENLNNAVYINGTNAAMNKEVTLVLKQYEPGSHTYLMGNIGSLPGINQSQAVYQYGSNAAPSQGGQIVVTNSTTTTIHGSFDFEASGHITGTFIAPIP